jgi:hypothetical protein
MYVNAPKEKLTELKQQGELQSDLDTLGSTHKFVARRLNDELDKEGK